MFGCKFKEKCINLSSMSDFLINFVGVFLKFVDLNIISVVAVPSLERLVSVTSPLAMPVLLVINAFNFLRSDFEPTTL